MRDRASELNYYPKAPLVLQGITQALCIAPHPDDEVLGCGGALTLLARQGARVQSLIVTQGDQALGARDQDHAATRVQESRSAAHIMGSQPPVFLDFEDRHLSYTQDLIQAIGQALHNHLQPDADALLFLPSLSEPHPDHQAVALAGLAAALDWPGPLRVLFYEVGAPLHPNTYLDISAAAPAKWQALACFSSQLGLENYDGLSRAMATLRAFGKAPDCTEAEAYFEVDLSAVRRQGALAALPQWPWVRTRLELANQPQDLPLVSILIRSMDRPSLAETLASVAQQSYPNLDIVVVNASGHTHSPLHYMPHHPTVRLVQPEPAARLGRSQAANFALSQAQGSLALFLDDDDLIAPDHLQRLVQTLHQHSSAVAAYSGVRVVDAQGHTQREYDIPWHPHRLQGINFLPIHAVLFRLQTVRERQLRFDPSLPVLEDWDFWRQLGQGHSFVHSPGITATYRQSLGQSGLSQPGHDNHWQAWHLQLLQRYLAQTNTQDAAQCLAWHAIELDQADHRLTQAQQQLQHSQTQLQHSQAQLQRQSQQSQQHLAAREQLQQEFNTFAQQVQTQLADKETQLQQFAAQSNQALATKEQALHQLAAQAQQALDAKEQALQALGQSTNEALAAKEQALQSLAQQSNQALAAKDQALAELQHQNQQLSQQLHATQQRLQQLQAWAHKITRWLPSFLHHPKDPT